jgi:drug/metabolite transporter (DMT)-like permease
VLGETLSARAMFGCALMLVGMLIAQLVPLYLQKTPPSAPHAQ